MAATWARPFEAVEGSGAGIAGVSEATAGDELVGPDPAGRLTLEEVPGNHGARACSTAARSAGETVDGP